MAGRSRSTYRSRRPRAAPQPEERPRSDGAQAGKALRLCFLTFDPGTAQPNRFTPFFQRLRDLGYVNGLPLGIIVASIARVLVLTDLVDPIAAPQTKELENAARALRMTLTGRDIRTADDLPAAFDVGARSHAEGLLTTAESIFVVQGKRVVDLAAQHGLAGPYPYEAMVDAGGLMAYDSYTPNLVARAATYVDMILRARSLPTCPSSRHASMTSSSTSRPPGPSG